MIEQHTEIVESNLTDTDKIARLWEVCNHLYKLADEQSDSHRDFLYLKSLMRRMKSRGLYLKVDQVGDDFKATFWQPDGDCVKAFSHTDKDLVEAIERAGTKAGSQEVIAMIRAGYQANGLELK